MISDFDAKLEKRNGGLGNIKISTEKRSRRSPNNEETREAIFEEKERGVIGGGGG